MIFYFILAISTSFIFTLIIKNIAGKLKIVDIPSGERKIHKKNIPLLGGTAVFLSFFSLLYLGRNIILAGDLDINHWLGFFMGGVFLIMGGILDDKYGLNPKLQIIFPILAALCVIFGGVSIEKITNPLGGFIYLDLWQFSLSIKGLGLVSFSFLSGLLIFIWLMGMMYTTKLLDGIDGLVTGMAAIGSFIIFLFTMTTKYYQPDIGFASLMLCGACLGFLLLNWHPAKIFLGEGGSLFLGFSLGVLSIISGGKIAIALLIMGLPILDVFWTILRRLKAGKNPFKFADRKHLHFRILDLGLGQRKTVLIYYLFAFMFGLSALFLQSMGKLLALSILTIIMLIIIICFSLLVKNKAT